jgi:sarcosine oxidase subunit alpha
VWRIRARHVLIATGAHERPIVFADNDRPGIMLAHSARTFLHRYGVMVGHTAVVFTTNDSAYAAAFDLADSGVQIEMVVDARQQVSEVLRQECDRRGIPVRAGAVVAGTRGGDRITHAMVAEFDGANAGAGEAVSCDTLLVSGGWNPAVHLFSQARGVLRYDAALGGFVPGEHLAGVSVAGAANGAMDLAGCLREGRDGGAAALAELGVSVAEPVSLPEVAVVDAGPGLVLWRVPGREQDQFVDVQRDATVADVARAVGAGMRSVEHIKRYTTIGTAHDQGKTSGVIASGITAELLGVPIEKMGTTTFRPPYTPVAFAALAGRDRGALFDPERTTALHDWHVAQGAVFEDVGQWKRPRYYPRPGEEMDDAVLRECAAVRSGVGVLDGSTLGKIDVQGRDAAELLDRIYTNLMSSLKVGSVRYGVMCGVDGMVIDDGTVMRLAEDRFLVYTTTGGAAKILDWMEEWLQTEWPQLQVSLASVTDHWATFPVVGPRSRDVIGAAFGQVDVTNEAFPFMTWRETTLDGVPVRLARVSFSGELAFEVNVNWWHAPAVWERLMAAGDRYAITPYGTETMHVLRAEKGYPIIGQDTDGTVSPHDLGMAWAVSKKKPDFIGKRSFSRVENQNPLRKQLVGLLPVDRVTRLPEGSQIVEFCTDDALPPPPVPMLGHVTSSYRSAELGRTFALALVKAGQSRVGDTLHVPVDGTLIPVEVTGSVLVDPEGARRDG